MHKGLLFLACFLFFFTGVSATGPAWGAAPAGDAPDFPRRLESYGDTDEPGIVATLAKRAAGEPFNVVATLIFFCATIGLLFVNISVGGTLSHFAAPPVLMVAGPWDWGMSHMLVHFGWKAVVGILIANGVYYVAFKREIASLEKAFALVSLKGEIERKYFKRQDLEMEFDRVECVLGTRREFVQAILKQYFENGVSPMKLLLGALLPTVIMFACFLIL